MMTLVYLYKLKEDTESVNRQLLNIARCFYNKNVIPDGQWSATTMKDMGYSVAWSALAVQSGFVNWCKTNADTAFNDYITAKINEQPINPADCKSKSIAGMLAIFLGYFGIHNFYLGFKKRACIQLALSLVGGLLSVANLPAGIVPLVIADFWAIAEGCGIFFGLIKRDAKGNPLK
jgi:TM2 domain-containing membrane protein YozV